QPIVLLITAHIAQFRTNAQCVNNSRCPTIQLIGDWILKGILKLGTTDPCIYRKVLDRLHKKRDPGDFRKLRLKPPENVARAHAPLCQGLQSDKNPPAVEGSIDPIHPDE